jgi:glycosyltransferase involved in cell wall biosynthesis
MKLSIIIPAYNEEKRIEGTLKEYLEYKWPYDVDLLVVLNGCRDNTLKIVEKVRGFHPELRYVEFKNAIGKGGALIEGFKRVNGDLISYVDADGATKPNELDRLVSLIGNCDGVIASRWIKGAVIKTKQPLIRRAASRSFNFLVRSVLGLKFKDTQTGGKIFVRDAIKDVLPRLVRSNWAIDVGILYPMVKRGYRIREVATVWEDKEGSKLKMWKAIPNMLWTILKLRFRR